jgi:hypothetical protein
VAEPTPPPLFLASPQVILPETLRSDPRSLPGFYILARLRPGPGIADAQAELDRIGDERYGKSNKSPIATPIPDTAVNAIRSTIWAVMGATGLVLVLGVASVSVLFMMQVSRRTSELAMRAAPGAPRGHLSNPTGIAWRHRSFVSGVSRWLAP